MHRCGSCNVGGGVTYTCCLRYPHMKKSIGIISGERGGHSWKPPYPIICSPNSSSRYTALLMMFCAHAYCHVGTIRSGAETMTASQPINVHFKRSVFRIHDHKVSFCTKLMML
ncbi:hypothetical protein AVEN_226846-1 [Araneus ventricosus]|uniref:Uncharacterized protein n=1 Tax=Araneus ventricosus TaxID=182803 RepID=A0A4Y2EYU6_ARAVE|nr:hypothetical protein AVEN_226846-1 [Araneus ventricosus]